MNFIKSKPEMSYIDILPDSIQELEAVSPNQSKQIRPVTIRCYKGVISEFPVTLASPNLPKDFELVEMMLTRQMQQQHGVDVRQSYWDWHQAEDGSITVYAVARDRIDQLIQQLPVGYEVEAIVPFYPVQPDNEAGSNG